MNINTSMTDIQVIMDAAHEKARAQSRKDDLAELVLFIPTANLSECNSIIHSLIGRVSELLGVASELEDAYCVIEKEIENERR